MATDRGQARAASEGRRSFLARLSGAGMAAGLIAAYGTLAAFMVRFLYPARPTPRGWLYVIEAARLPAGKALLYETPDGTRVNVARQRNTGSVDDFVALSSRCPHLGCQVHWEAHNDRFFCPCHNGVFTPDGVAVAGPPADAGQSLPRYPLKVEGGLLFIEVPLEQVARGRGRIVSAEGPPGPGHDPCLYARRDRPRRSA